MYGPQLIDLGSPVADHQLNAGLAAWWLPLPNRAGGGTLFDLGGRYPAALTNGPTWTAGANGFAGVSFDGVDDYAVNTTLDPARFLTNATSEAVVTPASVSQSAMIVTCGRDAGGAPFQGWSWGISTTGSPSDQLSGLANGVAWASSGWSFPAAGRAYHVVVRLAGGTGWTFFVNGVQVGTASATAPVNNTTGDIRLGSQTGQRFFAGRVDSHRLYDRAVSAGEAAGLYDQWRRGYPDLLRRYTPRAWLVGASPPPPPPPADGGFVAAVVGGGFGW